MPILTRRYTHWDHGGTQSGKGVDATAAAIMIADCPVFDCSLPLNAGAVSASASQGGGR